MAQINKIINQSGTHVYLYTKYICTALKKREKKMNLLGSIGLGTGIGLIDRELQAGQNKRFIKHQIEAQKELTEYNKEQQIDLFNRTGADAVVKQLDKAGLNRGLILLWMQWTM